ncbi:MAG: multiheme c-type cytochrome, partial [Myxococcota bacterium]
NPLGGLSRRNTTLEKLRAEGPVVVVDAGNLFSGKPVLAEKDRPQQVEKARLQAAAYSLAGIDAMLPGAGDLALGIDTVRELAATHELPYVAANLECGGGSVFPSSITIERGGVDIAFVGVVGSNLTDPTCRATEPVAAVKAALEGAKADVVVVLSGQTAQEDEALAAAIPAISLLVNGQDRQQLQQPRPLPNGGLLLASGSRGKQLGVLSFTLTPGATSWRDAGVLARLAEQKDTYASRRKELEERIAREDDPKAKERLGKQADFLAKKAGEIDAQLDAAARQGGPAHAVTNTLVDMSAGIADHPATAALVAAAKERIAKVETISTVSAVATGPFAGTSACTGCHAAQATQWGTTGHARAWATLSAAGSERDRACFSCHVTGAFHDEGPKDPGAVAGLEAVGCEACHGPGKAHVKNPTVDMVKSPDVATCTTCHDGKQDMGRFDHA